MIDMSKYLRVCRYFCRYYTVKISFYWCKLNYERLFFIWKVHHLLISLKNLSLRIYFFSKFAQCYSVFKANEFWIILSEWSYHIRNFIIMFVIIYFLSRKINPPPLLLFFTVCVKNCRWHCGPRKKVQLKKSCRSSLTFNLPVFVFKPESFYLFSLF